jgi:hypothetical protein
VTADGGKLSHEREAELQAALLKVCGGDQNTTATSISA